MNFKELYPTYANYSTQLGDLPQWRKVIGYALKLVLYSIGYFFIGLFILFIYIVASAIKNGPTSTEQKYPSSKYKKVVKEGILWDSTEYHER